MEAHPVASLWLGVGCTTDWKSPKCHVVLTTSYQENVIPVFQLLVCFCDYFIKIVFTDDSVINSHPHEDC